jgi:diguanylate cyclase (GGDEF)-like protein/PAS domain S-box-containing protein
MGITLFLLAIYFVIYIKRGKKALRQTNEVLGRTKIELETFVANLPGGAFRYSADEKAEMQFVSDGLLKMFGYTKKEFDQKFANTFPNMIYVDDRTKTLNSIKQQTAKSNFSEVKYRIVTADGRTRWVLNRAQIVTHESGYSEFCAVVVDITESRQAHKRASDAMVQLQVLSNSISGGVAQFLYDDGNLTLVYASEGFYKLSGQTKEEYARQNNSGGTLCAYSEDQAGLQFTINRQIAKQAPLDVEYRLIQKNGKMIWISLSGTPTVNRHNQIIYQCIFTDITSFKNTQEELEQERERYQIAESLSDDIMFEYNIVKDYMKFSPLFTALTGSNPYFPDYLKGIEQNDSICSADLPGIKEFFKDIGLGHSDAGAEFRFKTKSGDYIWHQFKAKVVYDAYGKPLTAVGKAYNVDEQKVEMQRLTDKSQRDGLTNLYNKVSTQSQIEDDLKELETGGEHALIVIDIDNFKAINDSFGHLVGDGVIRDIAAKIQVLFRTSDVVGRIGGDEFVVFLRGVSSDDMVKEKAKAICDVFRNTHPVGHADYQISASLGIAICPTDGTTYQQLFPKADLALYQAKNLGKDCYAFYPNQPDSTPIRCGGLSEN